MKLQARPSLQLERLDDRIVPALSVSYNGSLTLTGTTFQPVTVTEVSPQQFKVMEGTVSYGSYRVTGNLTMNLGNTNDKVTLTTLNNAGALSIPGTVTFNTTNGNDSISILGQGRIGGGLNYIAGNGNDSLSIGGTVRVSGVSNLDLGAGFTQNVTIAANTFGNSMTLSRVNTFTLPSGAVLNGNLTINNGTTYGQANNITIGGTVAGSFSFTGSTGNDSITIASTAVLHTVLNQSTNIALDDGSDTVTIAGTIDLGAPLTISSGTEGPKTVTLSGTITGDSTVGLSSSNDNFTFSGSGFGDVSINLGSGDDSAFFGANSFLGGGDLILLGDAGIDIVNFLSNSAGNLTIDLGQGADSFFANSPTAYGAATIDLGVDADIDRITLYNNGAYGPASTPPGTPPAGSLYNFTTFLNIGGADLFVGLA